MLYAGIHSVPTSNSRRTYRLDTQARDPLSHAGCCVYRVPHCDSKAFCQCGVPAAEALEDVVLMSTTPAGRPLRTHPVTLDGTCVRVSGLEPGVYRLDVHPCRRSHRFRVVPPPGPVEGGVAEAPAVADVRIGPYTLRAHAGRMLSLALDQPLHVRQLSCSAAEGVKASIGGGSGRLAACVTLSRFCHTVDSSAGGRPRRRNSCRVGASRPVVWLEGEQSVFEDSIAISDEERYILDRRRPGRDRPFSTLPIAKPSLLTHAAKAGAARNVDRPGAAGGTRRHRKCAPAEGETMDVSARGGAFASHSSLCAHSGLRESGYSEAAADCGPQFCRAALVLPNVGVGEGGVLHIAPEDLPEGWASEFSVARLVVFATDGSFAAAQAAVHRSSGPPASPRPRLDPRVGRRLPPDAPHIRQKSAVVCAATETLTIDNAHAADVTIIDSMHDVHALFSALMRVRRGTESLRGVHAAQRSADSAWQEFAFLGTWGTLSLPDKLKKLDEKACYELFLFLKFADEGFFAEHVRPLLAMRAPSERDTMTLILTHDTDALAACMRDMHAVSRMTALEVLLAAAELGDPAMLRAAALRWRTPPALRELQQWEERRFDVALQHGALSSSAAPPPAPSQYTVAARAAPARRGPHGGAAPPPPQPAAPIAAMSAQPALFGAADGMPPAYSAAAVEEEAAAADAAALASMRQEAAAAAKADFAFENTLEWREAGYWQEQTEQRQSGSVGRAGDVLSSFWADWAAHLLNTLPGEGDEGGSTDTVDAAESKATRLFLSRSIHTAPLDFTTATAAAGLLARAFQNIPTRAGARAAASTPEPTAAAAHEFDGCAMRLTAASPLFAFTHEVAVSDTADPSATPDTSADAAAPELLGYMSIVDPRDSTITDEATGERRTKVATGPLVVHRTYALRVIVSNPTPDERQLEAVLPLPGGAVALGGAGFVETRGFKVAPFACIQHEVKFYFPEAGEFVAPVASILRRELLSKVVQLGTGTTIQVVTSLPPSEAAASGLQPGSRAWLLSTHAADADVLGAVSAAAHMLPLADIAWRAKRSADFHRQLLAALRAAATFDEPTWRLALHHRDTRGVLEWLAGQPQLLTRFIGVPFDCGAAKIGRAAADLRMREFWPLVNQRAHSLGGRPALVCPQLEAAWRAFLCFACRLPRLSAADLLEAACFMAAMDRLPESADLLRRADAAVASGDPMPACMQRDYLWAFLTLSKFSLRPQNPGTAAEDAAAHLESQRELLASVQATTEKHVNRCPGRWATLWGEMATYVAELCALCAGRESSGRAAEDAAGKLDASTHAADASRAVRSVDAFLALDTSEAARGRITVSTPAPMATGGADGAAAAEEWLEVAYREVDVEAAFSRQPFDSVQGGDSVLVVRPAWQARVRVEQSGSTEIDLSYLAPGGRLPGGVAEVRYGRLREEATMLPHSARVHLQAERGMLTVLAPTGPPHTFGAAAAAATRLAPVEGAYVKVYAKVGGASKFWRDGYTDCLGRLEYARSTGTTTAVLRFAVLVLCEEHGACVSVVDAPSAVRSR
eukprot:jgi/Ulvmu1/5813/UM025_0070.1